MAHRRQLIIPRLNLEPAVHEINLGINTQRRIEEDPTTYLEEVMARITWLQLAHEREQYSLHVQASLINYNELRWQFDMLRQHVAAGLQQLEKQYAQLQVMKEQAERLAKATENWEQKCARTLSLADAIFQNLAFLELMEGNERVRRFVRRAHVLKGLSTRLEAKRAK